MNYYLGAYYLVKLKPLTFGSRCGQKILTGSSCINESYFGAWSLSWTEDGKDNLSVPKKEFNLKKAQIRDIQNWADKKFDENCLGWANLFADIATLIEYKTKFFTDETDFEAIAIYFPENIIVDFIDMFEPKTAQIGEIGMLTVLKKRIAEQTNSEIFIGYDLIGIEYSGDYHSFQCYDFSKKLIEKFGITLNDSGLINDVENQQALLDYANDPDNGLPNIPWYLVKVKKAKL